MPQRKDTPAARAALARRRQRAAQNLKTAGIATATATDRPSTQRNESSVATSTNSGSSGLSMMTKVAEKRTNAITINTNKRGQLPTNHNPVAERRATSTTLGNKNRHQSRQQPVKYDVRTEMATGLSSTPSTEGQCNVETVLEEGTSTGAPLYFPTSSDSKGQLNVLEQKKQQHINHSPEKYERISNFGYVEMTSPQPMVPDRRDLIRYESSSPSKEVISSTPSESSQNRNIGNLTSKTAESDRLQLPSLQASTNSNSDSRKQSSKKNRKDTAIPRQTRNPKIGTSTKTKFATNTGADTTVTKQSLPKRDKSTQKTSSSSSTIADILAGKSPTRVSKMPSPSTVNTDSRQSLPRRNASPGRVMSPEKKLSPHRFRSPKNDDNIRPTSQQAPLQPASVVPTRNPSHFNVKRVESNKPVRNPPQASLATSKYVANVHSTSSTQSDSKSQFYQSRPATDPSTERHYLQHRNMTSEKSDRKLAESSENFTLKEADLSEYLMDSCSIVDTSIIIDSEQQHLNISRTSVMRSRVEIDENDAKYLNVQPGLTTHSVQKFGAKIAGKEIQSKKSTQTSLQRSREINVMDAACLHSGDLVMIRSCSVSTTLQEKRNAVFTEFDGPCLGKLEESLRVAKVGDNKFSPLVQGDRVTLQSPSKTLLGARWKRNDVHRKNEIGFFDDSHKNCNQWMIYSATFGTSILVGQAAVTKDYQMQTTRTFIRSGESIVLVNCSNGGMLSVRDGVVMLLTDSYDPERTPTSGDPSLLGRLGGYDRIEPSTSETFQLLKVSIPPCPTWVTPRGMGERLFLNGTYLLEPSRNQNVDISVDRYLSSTAKENILVDEVIGSFLGLEGLYIKMKESEEQSEITFQLFDCDGVTFDLSLRNLVEQILPLSTSYVRVKKFIGLHYPGYEYGQVMQAFCERLDLYLQQFVTFIAKLEYSTRKPPPTGTLTMKNIHFEITPLLHSMSILEQTTKTVHNKKGGALINALRSLEKTVYMGDTVAKDILGTLVDQASVPYAEMLSIWLQSGRLCDPYEEFMVMKTRDLKNGVELDGDTWANVFMINEEHVINDIVRNEKFKNKILITGKYWNAVQACTVDVMSSDEMRTRPLELEKLQFQSDLSGISALIDTMYESASEKLLHILRDKFHLKESLQIMKRYFLLDQGDFLVNFLEAVGEELAKPFEEVYIGRVQHFLGISIQFTESQREDEIDHRATRDNKKRCKLSPNSLRCKLADQSLVSYLDSLYGGIEDQGPNTPSRQKYGSHKQGVSGFDFFEIDFPRVPFPISLIISPTAMENYKLLFRHLFFAKHVERRLVGVWSDHQVLKKLDSLRGLLGPTFLLRQRMLHCVQNLMNYMTFEVVESNWLEMLSSIDIPEDASSDLKQRTIDDLLNIHHAFLQKTIDSCLLTNPILIKSLIKLLNTCLLFTDQMKRFMDTTKIVSMQKNLR